MSSHALSETPTKSLISDQVTKSELDTNGNNKFTGLIALPSLEDDFYGEEESLVTHKKYPRTPNHTTSFLMKTRTPEF